MEVSGQIHAPATLPPENRRLGGPQSQSGCGGEEKNSHHCAVPVFIVYRIWLLMQIAYYRTLHLSRRLVATYVFILDCGTVVCRPALAVSYFMLRVIHLELHYIWLYIRRRLFSTPSDPVPFVGHFFFIERDVGWTEMGRRVIRNSVIMCTILAFHCAEPTRK